MTGQQAGMVVGERFDPHALKAIRRRMAGYVIVWICIFSSGFVIREPAPYELMLVPVIAGWFIFGGLKLYPQFGPAFLLMMLFSAGGFLSLTQATTFDVGPMFVTVTLFLVITFFFFANLIAMNRRVLPVIRNAYIISATIVATLGTLGYFGVIPGAELFTLFDRAKGTFEDPNVFGPFLVFPIALLTHDLLTRPLSRTFWQVPIILILLFGLFLSFSRTAWGMAFVTLLTVTVIVFISDPRPIVRMRIFAIAAAGIVLLGAGLAVALSFDAVADLFSERAKLAQPYDSARLGRFARYSYGFTMAFESPLGIGPMQFRNFFPEDPHNVYMKSLLDYGWIGGFGYIGFTLWTVVRGFPLVFKSADWSVMYRAAYVTFLAHVFGGLVIDTDHWRHLFLIYGIVWGCIIIAERDKLAQRAVASAPPRAVSARRRHAVPVAASSS
ncbi:MAG: O-antigen ligase family protein [Pseudomonadota bacterium]